MKRGEVFKSRKAQITVFIIIGIILVFSVGVYYYMKQSGVGPGDFFQPKTPPVELFIQQCLESTARDAMVTIGQQGGYLRFPEQMAVNPSRYVSLVPGVGGPYAPKIPMWYYEAKTEIPSLAYIEKQIEIYVEENLNRCLENFTALKEEFRVIPKADHKATVTAGEYNTLIKLDWPVEIIPLGSGETVTKDIFEVTLDVPLAAIWNLAKELLEAENEKMFFEKMTIDLMASHPPEDIPFTGMDFQCGRLTWFMSDIKEKVQYALVPAMQGVRFRNTNHPPFIDPTEEKYEEIAAIMDKYTNLGDIKDMGYKQNSEGSIIDTGIPMPKLPKDMPADTYEYFQYYFNFTSNDYNRFKVFADYKKDWGMKLVATPNQYGMMKSGVRDLKSQILSYLCLNTYHFVYDVYYPVVITINYPSAFYGDGYNFKFAFPVQIFHNRGDRSIMPAKYVEPDEFDLEYCDFYGPETHQIIVLDKVTNAELPRVNLTFTCLKEQCKLGATKTNNQHFIWEGPFPDGCYAPLITAEKPGYLTAQEQYDYKEPFYMHMYPTVNVTFEVKRVAENAPQAAKFLDPDMHAIISIENINPSMSQFAVFAREDSFNFTKPTLELLRADTTYQLSIMLAQRKSESEDLLIGGWVGNWTVRSVDMQDAKKVQFNVLQKYPAPSSMDDMEDMTAVYNLIYDRTLYPDVKPIIIRSDEAQE